MIEDTLKAHRFVRTALIFESRTVLLAHSCSSLFTSGGDALKKIRLQGPEVLFILPCLTNVFLVSPQF